MTRWEKFLTLVMTGTIGLMIFALLLGVSLLFAPGCRHNPPPPPPPQPRTVAVVTLPDAVVWLNDSTSSQQCRTGADGVCNFLALPSLQYADIIVSAVGYDLYFHGAVELPPTNVQVRIGIPCDPAIPCVPLPALTPTFVPLPRLATNGTVLRLLDGTPFTAIEASDFDLYHQYLAGGDIDPILLQRAGLGFNTLRVFGAFNGVLGRFVPTDYGERWYTALPTFARRAAARGLYVELTVFADTTQWLSGPGEQVTHWNKTVAALAGETNVLLEAVNEADQPINLTTGLSQFAMPTANNSSHGSNGSQAWPVSPFWHYLTFHTNGADEWWRKVGHNCWEIDTTRPCIANENTRPDQDPVLAHFYDAAAGAALLAAGSTFHSNSGKASVMLAGQDLAAAQQWVAGAKSVSLACQNLPYKNLSTATDPVYLRIYQRGSDPACIVRIRR